MASLGIRRIKMDYYEYQHLFRKNCLGKLEPGLVIEVAKKGILVQMKDGFERFNPEHPNNWLEWEAHSKRMETAEV